MSKQNQNQRRTAKLPGRYMKTEDETEMNRPKTRTTRVCFCIIRANGKIEQHILIFDPAELHSLKVNVFVELHRGDRLDDYFDLRDLTERI